MFGNKDAGFREVLSLFGRRWNGKARKAPDFVSVTPVEAYLRKERYFAMASADRWNR
jgi:hypothetical protein